MRPPLALAAWLALTTATAGAAVAERADWRRAEIDERVKLALIGQGWRLEDDGLALDPKTKAPAPQAALEQAVLDLRQGASLAALERLRLILAAEAPAKTIRSQASGLVQDLPPELAAAVLDPKSDVSRLKAMTESSLGRAAAHFDGSRTLADLQAAAQPVPDKTSEKHPSLPYFNARDRTAGDNLRRAAAATIGRDPFGRQVLGRLNGKNGKPDLPPVLIDDLQGNAIAVYDFRRGAIVIDRERMLSSIVEDAPAPGRLSLRKSLSSRPELLDYLAARPETAASFAAKNEMILVHELTHAWQDRREPVLHEIARRNLPDAQLFPYEEEAFAVQSLYVHSRLNNAPESIKDAQTVEEYLAMTRDYASWRRESAAEYLVAAPALAMDLPTARQIQARRIEAAKSRAANDSAAQQAKALELAALQRADRELSDLQQAQKGRLDDLRSRIARAAPDRHRLLAAYYLAQARLDASPVDRSVKLDKAAIQAAASGDKSLIRAVRRARGNLHP